SSTNMSQEDIDKAVREAEKFAEEDKKMKEAVDTKNHAESLIFQIEKSLTELGDKVSADEKATVDAAISKLKETIKSDNVDAIKADTEALEKAFYPIAEKIYAAQGGAQQADPNMGGAQGGDGTYYDTGFEDHSDQ
ncbi:MAG: Hsp70 family protein, partial [Clostridia bacterium]|nr:Hsp70 family protein [Clostridia bacterium]